MSKSRTHKIPACGCIYIQLGVLRLTEVSNAKHSESEDTEAELLRQPNEYIYIRMQFVT